MRIGHVIGKVTMSIQEEAFRGGRWLVINPVDTEDLNSCIDQQPKLSTQSSLVVYDNIGAGEGDIIGFVEGAEATAPFDGPTPIDAISLAIFDTLKYVAPAN
ncbi:MAG: EutN/CcmL family microcompartment protein [Akkermansiaceae bacterium]|nr:EutN/CcmL family microcompartment protein [Akkermansiaceae bacterium]